MTARVEDPVDPPLAGPSGDGLLVDAEDRRGDRWREEVIWCFGLPGHGNSHQLVGPAVDPPRNVLMTVGSWYRCDRPYADFAAPYRFLTHLQKYRSCTRW